jgi:hypothetical protein
VKIGASRHRVSAARPVGSAQGRQGDPRQIWRKGGAAGGYRTYDLSLTKGVLYH